MEHEELLKIYDYIEEGNYEKIEELCKKYNLEIKNGKIIAKNQEEASYYAEHYDFLQYSTKILLNSVYGSILNQYMRFYDRRIGQSVTLTGRCITRHMASFVNELITGEYRYDGDAVLYGDTDSCYFTAYPFTKDTFDWNKDNAVILYDKITDILNSTFTEFMVNSFNTRSDFCVIEAGRELIASKAFFVKKKKYACLYYDKEGKRLDKNGSPGEFKIMGLEIKRSDCPFIVRDFLEQVVKDILIGKNLEKIVEDIKEFRKYLKTEVEPWKLGIPKKANGMKKYYEVLEQQQTGMKRSKKRVAIPGHIRASMNWNTMIEKTKTTSVPKISDGMKIVYCNLKETDYSYFTSIAYPIEIENRLPSWFKAYHFDVDKMIETGFDNKIKVIFEALDYDLNFDEENEKKKEIINQLFEF